MSFLDYYKAYLKREKEEIKSSVPQIKVIAGTTSDNFHGIYIDGDYIFFYNGEKARENSEEFRVRMQDWIDKNWPRKNI